MAKMNKKPTPQENLKSAVVIKEKPQVKKKKNPLQLDKIKNLKQVREAQSYIATHPSNNPFKDSNTLTALRDLRSTLIEESRVKKESGVVEPAAIVVSFVKPGSTEVERIKAVEETIKQKFGIADNGKRN